MTSSPDYHGQRQPFREIGMEAAGYTYGSVTAPAVDNVSFRVRPGEFVAIVGPNGCGKSTLLKLFIGAISPSVGRVVLDGETLSAFSRISLALRVTLVPQMGLSAGDAWSSGTSFSVREVVLMSRYATHADAAGPIGRFATLGFHDAADLDIANRAMWNADIHHLADRSIDTLSGGERQRVAIARALAQLTPVILLDEPTSALDPFHQLELIAQLEELALAGRAILMVTHDLNLAARCATRVLVMDQGRVVADGNPRTVLTPAVLEPVYRVKVEAAREGFLWFTREGVLRKDQDGQ